MKLRWQEFLVAFFMAVILWYGLSGSEKLESQMEVRVDYRGLPQGLVVTRGHVNKVSVRVRASMGMLRSLGGREFAFFMDLSNVRKGENTLVVNPASLPFSGGVAVMDVTPSRITLDVDTLESKILPLVAKVSGDISPDLVAHAIFTPSEVTLSGPSALLEGINSLTMPVVVEESVEPGVIESRRLVPLPDGVDVSPTEVKQSLQIGIRRRLVTMTRVVQVDTPAHFGKFVRPDKVSLAVAMPQSLAAKAASNNEVRAFVALDESSLGSYTLPVQVSLPEGAELVEIDPPSVTVTLEQRGATPPKKK